MKRSIFSLVFFLLVFLPVPTVEGVIPAVKSVRSVLERYLDAWNPEARKRIVVSQREQKLYLFHKSTLLAVFTVSTGRNDYTPDGTFRIYYKKEKVRHRGGDGMHYWMEFKPKYGLHGLPFDELGVEYGAEELGKPASAGCVRMENALAGLLYRATPTHSLVVIQQAPPSY